VSAPPVRVGPAARRSPAGRLGPAARSAPAHPPAVAAAGPSRSHACRNRGNNVPSDPARCARRMLGSPCSPSPRRRSRSGHRRRGRRRGDRSPCPRRMSTRRDRPSRRRRTATRSPPGSPRRHLLQRVIRVAASDGGDSWSAPRSLVVLPAWSGASPGVAINGAGGAAVRWVDRKGVVWVAVRPGETRDWTRTAPETSSSGGTSTADPSARGAARRGGVLAAGGDPPERIGRRGPGASGKGPVDARVATSPTGSATVVWAEYASGPAVAPFRSRAAGGRVWDGIVVRRSPGARSFRSPERLPFRIPVPRPPRSSPTAPVGGISGSNLSGDEFTRSSPRSPVSGSTTEDSPASAGSRTAG
jgi:hypothetical protein